MSEEGSAVVIDIGSSTIKAGFAGEDNPRATFPTIVAHQAGETYVGIDAQQSKLLKGKSSQPKCPMEHGIVTNWDDMEAILRHTFQKELNVAPEERPVLLTQAVLNPTSNGEKLAQVMFETFDVPAMHLAIPGVLSMYDSGRTTGLVLDCGDTVTQVVPIYEGCMLLPGIRRFNSGGRNLTDYMLRLLSDQLATSDQKNARYFKEKACYVSQDFEEDMKSAAAKNSPYKKNYTLNDGQTISLSSEHFRCPEALFQPELLGVYDQPGIHEMIINSIHMCHMTVRKTLCANIILSGGGSMFTGLVKRLECEIARLLPSAMEPKVTAPENRIHSVWIGGSIVAPFSSFTKQWITRQEYDEYGPQVVGSRRLDTL